MLPILEYGKDLPRLFSRSQTDISEVNEAVKKIIAEVRKNGDKALFAYTKQFDNFDLSMQNILLTKGEIDEAVAKVPKKIMDAMRRAKDNIVAFHKRQMPKENFETKNGATTGFVYRAVSSAGIYVPGGKAAYPSSVLMCALPAVVAGVEEIVMVTPPGKYLNPLTIAAAKECGVNKIFRVGGAQAIAALAYGTESIPKADVIVGPGNIFVAVAKKEVYGQVGIDMLAGPSEILIIADNSANADFVAADMLSQAEHDELAASILLTTDKEFANAVNAALQAQLEKLTRKEIAKKSLENYGTIVLCDSLDQAAELSNKLAPEHLELCVKEPKKLLLKIKHAGAIFMGNYSPEPLGDYFAGSNHVLPTSSTARFSSGLGVDTYLKRISVIDYSKDAFLKSAEDIITLATVEELTAHAESVRIRTQI